jgi:hypothetical protein
VDTKYILAIVWRVVKIALPLAVVVAVVAGLVCWLAGWRAWSQYADALRYAAIAAVIIGGIGFMSRSGVGSEMVVDMPSTSVDPDFAKQKMRFMDRELFYFFIGALVAVFLFLLSLLLRSFPCVRSETFAFRRIALARFFW